MAALAALGCAEEPTQQALPSLERSGPAAFVCLGPDSQGRGIDACPDTDAYDDEERHLYALVTQTLRGEVAAVNMTDGVVVDYDPNVPGYEFLPVGANPVDIVSTPGGMASFVSVAEAPDKHGIFALPSSCLTAPTRAELPRGLTTWPACALPSAPGSLALLIDPPDPSGRLRQSCDSEYDDDTGTSLDPTARSGSTCPGANLGDELAERGRRKLLVTLPDFGLMGLIDAQSLLAREPGSFDRCDVERWTKLGVELPTPTVQQPVPADLEGPPECAPVSYSEPPRAEFYSRPAQLARAEHLLYVTDLGAPVVHRLEVKNPCAIRELPPLLPVSFEQPHRTVLTNAIALSPVTTQGQRFAYVVDDAEGSVMVFDLSPGTQDPTPRVRPGTPRVPFEPADRIAFGSPARALEVLQVDLPEDDPVTGVAPLGVFCNPDPTLSSDSPAAQYRPNATQTTGARPSRLRGVFGMVALANGKIGVIDVEDYDAPCRRPKLANPGPVPNFQGCSGDLDLPNGYALDDGTLTVSGEISCNVVEPQRARSAHTMLSGPQSGVNAPALRTFPQLRSGTGNSLPTDRSPEAQKHPKLLAVNFVEPPSPAVVYVTSQAYQSGEIPAGSSLAELPTDPRTAPSNSLAFDYREPRAFATSEEVLVTYEGPITAERSSGYLQLSGSAAGNLLRDDGAGFCGQGMEDLELARQRGRALGLTQTALETFARAHADYLQITADFPPQEDTYWSVPGSVGNTCGGRWAAGNGYRECQGVFGTPSLPTRQRDFVVFEAYQSHLVIQPRAADFDIFEQVYCCFGAQAAIQYVVRVGSQWVLNSSVTPKLHQVTVDQVPTKYDDYRCVRGCDPRRALFQNRALEVLSPAQVQPCPPASDQDPSPETSLPGCCLPGQCLACVMDRDGPIAPDSPCVFQNVTTRFAIYRGGERSQRDMSFYWQYSGGFAPLYASLLGQTTSVLPQWMRYVPQLAQLAVADGSSEGLALVSLQTLAVSRFFH
jgi:hypothetical protein